jgi:hypothetical protein
VLAIFAALSALYWAIVRFGLATQDGLSSELLQRLDGDPAHIQAYLDEMVADVTLAGVAGLLVGAILACTWLVLVDRNPPHGDRSARAKRGSWAGLMLLALLVAGGLFWFKVIGAPIAATLAPSIPLYATLAGLVLLAIGYWLATGLFAPASTKVAVPGGSVFDR